MADTLAAERAAERRHDVPPTEAPADSGAVWTFRGYGLRPSEFTTAMSHFYRGEIQRSNVWRSRLDNTTNWAVIAAGAAISFSLSDPAHHFGVIILDTLLVTLFLWIEARRYRYYELWSYRVRLMETDFFAAMLVPPFAPRSEWAESLAETLLEPDFPISMWEAFGRRFRRNYMWIYLILGAAWALKTFLHPQPAGSLAEFVARSAVGPLSGEVMLAAGLLFNGLLFVIGFGTIGLTRASGEVLPKFGGFHFPGDTRPSTRRGRPWLPGHRRQQLLALIISFQPEKIAERVMNGMRRGTTALHGRGMYSQQERDVLMVAVTATEMAQLKALVSEADPNAFVVVTPAREVLGRGFQPLKG